MSAIDKSIPVEKPTIPVINRDRLNYCPRELLSLNKYLKRGRKGISEYYKDRELKIDASWCFSFSFFICW